MNKRETSQVSRPGIATVEECMRFAGVDVGKHNHSVAVLDEERRTLVKPRMFSEDAAGYERLLAVLGEPGAVHVVMEATGHYWRNLFAMLVANEHRVSVVNATIPARFAKMELRRAKTDSVDALGLARYGVAMRPPVTPVPDEVVARLKELGRWRSRCVQDQGDKVRQLHRQMDLAFPEVGRVLRDLGCRRSTKVLSRYPSAAAIAKARPSDLARLVYDGRHRLGIDVARALVERARASVAGGSSEVAALIVPALCDDITRLRKRIVELDKHLEALGSEHELGALLTSRPGIGMTSAARFLGEAGDPSRFNSGAALAAYVGVVPATSTSGARQPESASICRIGHAKLRQALWMPTLVAVRVNPWLKAFYERMLARGKKPKVAMIAAMNKLLRAIWSICRSRKPFVLKMEAR